MLRISSIYINESKTSRFMSLRPYVVLPIQVPHSQIKIIPDVNQHGTIKHEQIFPDVKDLYQ